MKRFMQIELGTFNDRMNTRLCLSLHGITFDGDADEILQKTPTMNFRYDHEEKIFVDLWEIDREDLGLEGYPSCEEIHRRILAMGFEDCPIEAIVTARINYDGLEEYSSCMEPVKTNFGLRILDIDYEGTLLWNGKLLKWLRLGTSGGDYSKKKWLAVKPSK